MIKLKLFICSGEFLSLDVHLNIKLNVTALNENEAKENFIKKANDKGLVWLCETDIHIEELSIVDGYKIILVPIDEIK